MTPDLEKDNATAPPSDALPSALAKMTTIKEVHDYYQKIISCMPNNIYWLDKNCIVQGANANVLKFLGIKKLEDFIGLSYQKMARIAGWTKGHAEFYESQDREVMTTRTPKINNEDPPILHANGKPVYYLTSRVPLFDDEYKEVIGIVGISVDITERKAMEELQKEKDNAESAIKAMKQAHLEEQKHREEMDRLQLENTTHKARLEAQEHFTKMAQQVVHDIRSPLASILMIVKACEAIPERERIALRAASTRMSDIANNLLAQYKLEQSEPTFLREEKKTILLSATLLQLLTEKKFQYHDYPIAFDCQFAHSGQFAFISIEPSSFKRMVSNLINNAVEACTDRAGLVNLKIDASNEWVKVIVADNGKGMSPALTKKIMNNMAVTEGKVDGNGIGLTQVRETLSRNEGLLSIHSNLGQGVEIKLEFPRVKSPLWIAEEITIDRQDIIVILDDDHSIHGAWDSRFELILKQASDIRVYHFERGQEALTFIKTLSHDEKKRTLLLTDFELLSQELNGLDVVENANLSRSILVTSHYENPEIQKRAYALGAKILPKQLASEIPIVFNTKETMRSHAEPRRIDEFVHAILVDDDVAFIENVMCYFFDDNDAIVHFISPEELKDNLTKYPGKYRKDIKICLDNNFHSSDVKGIHLAQELHNIGYTQLYLISGDTFLPGELPEYITVLAKEDIGKIKDW